MVRVGEGKTETDLFSRLIGQTRPFRSSHFSFPLSLISRCWQKPAELDHLSGGDVLQIDRDFLGSYTCNMDDRFKHLAHQGLLDLDRSAFSYQAVHIYLGRCVHAATYKVIALIGGKKQNLGKKTGRTGLRVMGRCYGVRYL